MNLLENEALQKKVDYSFGDHSGVLGGVPNAYMKKANISNVEFKDAVASHFGPIMSLFIDNIRLYKRPLAYSDWLHQKPISKTDRAWLTQFDDENLLDLCRQHPQKQFVIFTAFEDTPLDGEIWPQIPENVISINATNAVIFGWKVRPFPHGIERQMHKGYNHHDILQEYIQDISQPEKLLLVCHRDDTGNRANLKDIFRYKSWASVPLKLDYEPYLKAIKNHKFVLCPSGNGIESARNWETLYMKRVPIFRHNAYLEEMFKDFPALFVDEFSQVTEKLLIEHDYLYQEAQKIDMHTLTLEYWFTKALN